jgi:predicted N-formylglutamate amidohydrolase
VVVPLTSPAYEICGDPAAAGPLVITCEHASAQIPEPLRASPADRPWLVTHWALDIGAATVARELVRLSGSMGLLARASRLICDLNRPPDHPEWILREIEGHELSFNQALGPAERERRRLTYFMPYHQAVDVLLSERLTRGPLSQLLTIHSFTPKLGDEVRTMELGLLFDEQHVQRANKLASLLRHEGFVSALNEPYDGFDGVSIYSVWRHGTAHGVPYIEIEVRQDLIGTPARARAVAGRIWPALERFVAV